MRAAQLQHNFLSIAVVGIACHSPIPLNSFIIYSSLRFSRIINENGISNANNNIDGDGGMFEFLALQTFDRTILNVLCAFFFGRLPPPQTKCILKNISSTAD